MKNERLPQSGRSSELLGSFENYGFFDLTPGDLESWGKAQDLCFLKSPFSDSDKPDVGTMGR